MNDKIDGDDYLHFSTAVCEFRVSKEGMQDGANAAREALSGETMSFSFGALMAILSGIQNSMEKARLAKEWNELLKISLENFRLTEDLQS